MRLSVFLPARLRVGLRTFINDARSMTALGSPLKPVSSARHTSEELLALSHEAAQARAARLSHAQTNTTSLGLRAKVRHLTVRRVLRTTEDAVTLVFDNPTQDPIHFTPGQFLTLAVTIDQNELRRAYSICSDPAENENVAVTIKRVRGGLVSNWINDHVTAGDILKTLGPGGVFGTQPKPERARNIVLIGGGSGITPLMSMLKALLRGEPQTHIDLVYANRSVRSILFHDTLNTLAQSFPERLNITHVVETPPEGWTGAVGMLVGGVLAAAVPLRPEAEYYICGPGPMMDQVTHYLDDGGIAASAVHLERFTAQARPDHQPSQGLVHSVRLTRSNTLLQVPDNLTLLESLQAAGIELNFSCTMGGCAACKINIISGNVVHDEPNCLTQKEESQGDCLTCIARPRSALVLDA